MEMGVGAVRSYHDNALESPLQVARSHANGSVSLQQSWDLADDGS